MDKVKNGGVTKIRSRFLRVTDIDFASWLQRIEMLEQQTKQIQERLDSMKTALKKDKEK